jgi:DNA-binding transcriptional ArsR family regulator
MEIRRDIFQAIADPTRRAIITLIAIQAMTPNALAEHFNTSRQAVSKHIKILSECDLVKQELSGREIYYSLEIEKMKEIDKWLNQFREIWEIQFNQLDKVLSTLKKQKK